MLIVILVVLSAVILRCIYVFGGEAARAEEQRLVAKVLTTFDKEETASKAFISKFLGRIDVSYARMYGKVLGEIDRVKEIDRADLEIRKLEQDLRAKL